MTRRIWRIRLSDMCCKCKSAAKLENQVRRITEGDGWTLAIFCPNCLVMHVGECRLHLCRSA
jgi:hypothetical protein